MVIALSNVCFDVYCCGLLFLVPRKLVANVHRFVVFNVSVLSEAFLALLLDSVAGASGLLDASSKAGPHLVSDPH